MRVFLTGGTGLVGSHVAARLRMRGDDVVALVRETSDRHHLETLGCRTVVGDVAMGVDAIAGLMRGCDAVVHAAAKVFQGGSRRSYLRVNVHGTEEVLRAAARVAPRVLHVSSVAVYSGLPLHAPVREDRWTDADPARQSAYAASKSLSERAAWRLHDASEIRLTTVRPSVVYGERDRAATPVFVRITRLPVIPLVAGGRTTVPVVYAGNVARAIVSALDRDDAVGRAYNLGRDLPITGRELAARFGESLGRRVRILSVPAPPLLAAAKILEQVTRLLPGVKETDTLRAIRSMQVDNPYDSARARLELGWRGHTPHDIAIRRSVEWWQGRS